MTIGGSIRGALLNSVELYNWKTGQQCFIDPLPQVGHLSKINISNNMVLDIQELEGSG